METSILTKNSANELHNQIQQYLDELMQATDKARTSQEMLRYLDFCARFHNYSATNIWLILMAKPDATYVAGYHKWKSMKRWVRRGEQGIAILAPILVKEEDMDGLDKQFLVGFKVVYVFDVAQTDGVPLPPPPDWKSPQKNEELNCRLIRFAESRGISVTFKHLPGEIQGLSKGGAIEIAPTRSSKTLSHEISHELLHRVENIQLSRAERELEAEAVAFVVCKHFGLDGLNSPNYMALYAITSEQIIAHLARICSTANEIITAIDPHS